MNGKHVYNIEILFENIAFDNIYNLEFRIAHC